MCRRPSVWRMHLTFHWEHPGGPSDLGVQAGCLSHPCLTGLVYIGELICLPVQVYAWGILALLGSAQVGAAVIGLEARRKTLVQVDLEYSRLEHGTFWKRRLGKRPWVRVGSGSTVLQ